MPVLPALTALALSLSLMVTACGSDDTSGPSTAETSAQVSRTEHNDADVDFASGMIQHHAQALAMVDLLAGRDLDRDVRALADDIRAAQAPEIETMADWLAEWGEDIPATVRDHANAGGHGGHGEGKQRDGEDLGLDMPGMVSAAEMAALGESGDGEFRDRWLEMMVEHHEGAVQMAATEQADGRYKPAVELAKDIQASQQAEIDIMEGLLSS